MKNKLDIVIGKIKDSKNIGIMTHLITGYPTLPFSKKIAESLVRGGADIIEIQIPFSDPMADGPLIVKACQDSLDNGTQVKDSFNLASFVSSDLDTPVVLMTYANVVFFMGIKNFCVECKKASVSGIIVPDLPYDSKECKELKIYANKFKIHLIYVVSPAIEDTRLKEVKKKSSGFIYCTSRQGTTGIGKSFGNQTSYYLKKVRQNSKLPIAVGFGVSSNKDVVFISKYSEIVVVGSALLNIIKNNGNKAGLRCLYEFISKIKNIKS